MPFSPQQIVLDSNIFISDYWLKKPSALLLEAFLRRTKAKLVIPRVVVEEVKNKHSQHVADATEIFRAAETKATKAGKELANLLDVESEVSLHQPESNKSYDTFFDDKLKALQATIPDYSDIRHETIVKRAIAKKKPFRSDDRGYRDALIWEAVLTVCSSKETTAFISNDTEAFWKDDDLHPDLKDDLSTKQIPSDRFRVFKSLLAFTDECVLPLLTQERDYLTLIKSGNFEGLDISEEIELNNDAISEAVNNRPKLMRDDAEYSEPTVTGVYEARDINVHEASEASEQILIVSLNFSVEVIYSFFLNHADTVSLEEDEHVVDWEWNEHTARVETTRPFRVSALIAFNLEDRDVESFEVEDVKREWRSWQDY
jgi:hypothetical protein